VATRRGSEGGVSICDIVVFWLCCVASILCASPLSISEVLDKKKGHTTLAKTSPLSPCLVRWLLVFLYIAPLSYFASSAPILDAIIYVGLGFGFVARSGEAQGRKELVRCGCDGLERKAERSRAIGARGVRHSPEPGVGASGAGLSPVPVRRCRYGRDRSRHHDERNTTGRAHAADQGVHLSPGPVRLHPLSDQARPTPSRCSTLTPTTSTTSAHSNDTSSSFADKHNASPLLRTQSHAGCKPALQLRLGGGGGGGAVGCGAGQG
jgi:hypothetical protein